MRKKNTPAVQLDNRMDKILETIISCKNEDQLIVAIDWVRRLEQKPHTKTLATSSFFQDNFENILYRKSILLLLGGKFWT